MFKELLSSEETNYVTKFPDGTSIFYRLLTQKEFRRLQVLQTSLELTDDQLYEEVYNYCVFPEFKDLGGNQRAGIPSSIGQYIIYQSHSTDSIENEIELYRERNNPALFIQDLRNTILMAFPNCTDEYLDSLNRLELVELFVKAENLLVIKSEGKYKPANLNTLRKPIKSPTIDIEAENKNLAKEGFETPETTQKKMLQKERMDQIKRKQVRSQI